MLSPNPFHLLRFLILLCLLAPSANAAQKGDSLTQQGGTSKAANLHAGANLKGMALKIAEPYIDIHTGPGRGYPVTYVATKGQLIYVKKQRTDWFKVSLFIRKGHIKTGWVKQSALALTLTPRGQGIRLNRSTREDYRNRKWEVGFLGGRFDSISTNSFYVGYAFSRYFSSELWLEDILGDFSSAKMATINIVHHPFPDWRVSPFFSLGAGAIKIKNKNRLLQNPDTNDDILNVGLGIKTYVSQRFMFRAEYKNYVLLTSRDENEEPEAWKLGFSLFF